MANQTKARAATHKVYLAWVYDYDWEAYRPGGIWATREAAEAWIDSEVDAVVEPNLYVDANDPYVEAFTLGKPVLH